MKALITALALLSFVGASTLPLASSAQAQTTDQTHKVTKKTSKKHVVAHKKSTTKHVAHKTSTKKHIAKHKTKKPATQQG